MNVGIALFATCWIGACRNVLGILFLMMLVAAAACCFVFVLHPGLQRCTWVIPETSCEMPESVITARRCLADRYPCFTLCYMAHGPALVQIFSRDESRPFIISGWAHRLLLLGAVLVHAPSKACRFWWTLH